MFTILLYVGLAEIAVILITIRIKKDLTYKCVPLFYIKKYLSNKDLLYFKTTGSVGSDRPVNKVEIVIIDSTNAYIE